MTGLIYQTVKDIKKYGQIHMMKMRLHRILMKRWCYVLWG